MKKGIFTFVLGTCLVAMSPFLVHADEPAESEEPAGLISGTLNTIGKTVGNVTGQAAESTGSILNETVKSVDQTVNDTLEFTGTALKNASNPVENKAITSTVKDTGKLVEKVVGNTTPAAKNAVKEVTGTTEKTTSEVFKAVDETVNNLPEVPVVTPVVKEVNKTVNQVTTSVQKTVQKTNDAVNGTVEAVTDTAEKTIGETVETFDKATDLPAQEEEAPALPTPEKDAPAIVPPPVETPKPAAPSPEPEAPTATEKPLENELPAETATSSPHTAPAVENAITVSKVQEPAAGNESGTSRPAAALGADIDATPEAMMYKSQPAASKNEPVKNGKNEASAASKAVKLPVNSEDQDRERPVAAIPASSGSSSTFASNSFAGHNADLGLGTLSDAEMLKASTEKLWYHKNSYALIQWIHTPLRKPPIHTPFLYVI